MPSVVYQQLCIDLATLASFRQGDRRLLTMVRLAKPSPRLYAAMEPRMSDKYGRELYAKLRFGSDQEDWHVVDVFLRREREMIGDSRQAIMWKSFLDLLRRANSLGMSDNGYWWFRRSLIPRDVARGIVLDAESYPLSAVAVAEQQLAQVAERASKRVGDIARRDGWFSDERG
jgi:hypothetical protein